jgi:CheY-like chemotaxis protein/anti-sigma regulatory factor (Ser/Thr protein kinase)
MLCLDRNGYLEEAYFTLEIARAHAEARAARARLHSQLMQAPIAVAILTGPHLVYELANPRYLELVGRSGGVVGRPVRAIFPELPHDASAFQLLEEVYTSGRPFTADEYRIPLDRRGNGVLEDVYFQLTCQPMRDVRGAVVGVMVVAADVTAQVRARTQAQEADRRKGVTFAPGGLRLEADATRLEQVVSNLLSNAARYTDPGGSIAVRVGREEVGGQSWAVLRVRDTGRGIPQAMLDRVFELFLQVDPTIDRTSGGLGIGLTLVKRLVGLHAGTVQAHSAGPGKGSEFIVRLPLAHEAPRGATRTPPPLPLPSPVRQPKRRVLVVEDRAAVRETMRVLLEGLGHEVTVSTDGLEGVTRALELRPDVAFVDVGLPSIDGYELARRVRATTGGNTLYLVALTGYGGPEAQANALQAGFDLHLVKPLLESDLLRVLEGSRGRSAAQGLPH